GGLIPEHRRTQLWAALPLGIAPQAYFVLSGTSMAAPVVAGAAALMLQKDPTLTPDDLKGRLMKSALKLPAYNLLQVGAGYLDVQAALDSHTRIHRTALSPSVHVAGSGWELGPTPAVAGGSATAWWINDVEGDLLLWGDLLL